MQKGNEEPAIMAQETTVNLPCFEENPEVDENLPPEAIVLDEMSKPTVEINADGYSSAQLAGENETQSETCIYSTPSQGSGKKSRISGFQSALTPILKYLNIGNRRQPAEPPKCEKNSPLGLSNITLGVTPVNCQHSMEMSQQRPFSTKTANVCWLDEECLPEITLLDDACDSTMQMSRNDSALPDSMLATPMKATIQSTFFKLQPSKDSACHPNDGILKAEGKFTNNAISVSKTNSQLSPLKTQLDSSAKASNSSVQTPVTVSEEPFVTTSCLQDNTFESKGNGTANLSQQGQITLNTNNILPPNVSNSLECADKDNADVHLTKQCTQNGTTSISVVQSVNPDTSQRTVDSYLPEITLLDMTRDSDPLPEADISTVKVVQEASPVDLVKESRCLSDLAALSVPVHADVGQVEEHSFALIGSVFHTPHAFDEQSKSSGDKPKSLESTRDVSVCSNMGNDTTQKTNVENPEKSQTSVESTSSIQPANVTYDMSFSSDVQAQQTTTSDIHCNNSLIVANVELDLEPMNTSNTGDPNTKKLANGHDSESMEVDPQSSPKMGDSMKNTFTVTPSSKLIAPSDFNTSNKVTCLQNNTVDLSQSNGTNPKAVIGGANLSANLKTAETSLAQICSDAKAHDDAQNATFERDSVSTSAGSSGSREAVAATFCLESTFDNKPPCKQSDTITLSEMSSSVSCSTTVDKPSLSDTNSSTSNQEKNTNKEHPSEVLEQNGTLPSTDSQTKTIDTTVSGLEASPAPDVTPVAENQPTSLSFTASYPGLDGEKNNSTFNLDDTLDMKSEPLVTSTPMPHFKVFPCTTQQYPEVEASGAQKKLYGKEPAVQVPLNPPSNIISNQKTFIQPLSAAKLILPQLKYKMASTLPRACEPFNNQPMTRQRAKAEALKNLAAPEPAQVNTGITSCQNVPATTTGSKPNTIPRPSGIQRPGTGLRPPSARTGAPNVGTVKLSGPTVHNPVVKPTQLLKHPLTRSETLQTAKRKKLDAHQQPGDAGASTTNCDAVKKASIAWQPAIAQKAAPVKTQRDDGVVSASTTGPSAQCYVGGRGRTLKQIKPSSRTQLTKPQSHGCAKCAELEEQLQIKSEEIIRLKKELLKYNKQKDC